MRAITGLRPHQPEGLGRVAIFDNHKPIDNIALPSAPTTETKLQRLLGLRPRHEAGLSSLATKGPRSICSARSPSKKYGASARARVFTVTSAPSPVPTTEHRTNATFAPFSSPIGTAGDNPVVRRSRAHSHRARPGTLLDRDGTIIVDYGYVGSIDRVELIEGAPEAIARFNQAGIPVAVLTNQSGVARGYYGTDDVEHVHEYIAARLAEYRAYIDLFLYCPYHPDGVVPGFTRESEDRKPRPGMALAAAQALNLDLSSSWVVGDRPEDVALAEAIGASPIYVGPTRAWPPSVLSLPNLSAAACSILERVA
jgi:D,D-heptose 1,7-bisphosphate phosphatase